MSLPKNYQLPPKTSRYLKFKPGQNKFRILSDIITGYEYWNTANKPVRSREYPDHRPDVRVEKGNPTSTKHFWAMVVWDYKDRNIKILQITQASIQEALFDLEANPDWGDNKQYDLTVTRTGEGMETSYTVMPSPAKELSMEAATAYASEQINLEALYDGEDPFAGGSSQSDEPEVSAEVMEEIQVNL